MLCAISLDPHICVYMEGGGSCEGPPRQGSSGAQGRNTDSVATGEARLGFQQQHARVHTSPGEEGQLAG